MTPSKIKSALVLLTGGILFHQVSVQAEAKFGMDDTGEMEIDAGMSYSSEMLLLDLDPKCATWARRGECNWNYEYMFEHCIETCIRRDDIGTIGYFLEFEQDEEVDGKEVDEEVIDECVNVHDSDPNENYMCEELAESGDCHLNPVYMMDQCARSCLQCWDVESKRFTIGVAQEIMEEFVSDAKHIEGTFKVIKETHEYMSTEVMEEPDYEYVRRSCFNDHMHCASMAAAGYCEDADDNSYYYFMMTHCAPACQTCLTYELIQTCTPNEDENIFKEGELDLMFRRIIEKEPEAESTILSDYESVVHSYPGSVKEDTDTVAGPWVVTLDNFLSDAECERLIELGERNSDDMDEYTPEELDLSTSLNSWCEINCYSDPATEGIIERMSEITGIPEENSEYLQMLKYSAEQNYHEYYEYDSSKESMPGPIVVTILLFLNDVEEGGVTRFNNLSSNDEIVSFDILPKKGSALIWSSMQNDPLLIDERTLPIFQPVLKGVKYGVKATFHLRSYDHDNCDYDAFSAWW